MQVLTDAQWAKFEAAIAAANIRGARPRTEERRTIEAIIWRLDNGAKWRSVPPELGDWHHAGFALQADRRMERALLDRHAADMAMLCERLRPETLDASAELAALPDRVRGYGPVKEAQFRAATARREALLAEVGRAETMQAA